MKTHNPNHAPGSGGDKHHPETPPDADERFREEEEKENEIRKNNR